jgi:hypothetical protein
MKTIETRELVTAEETGGRLTRTEIWVPADHVEPRAETRFEVLRGRMVLEREGRHPYRWCNGDSEELHVIMEAEVSPPAGA